MTADLNFGSIIGILLGALFSQDCTNIQALYDNASYLDANEKIKSIDVSNNEECLYLGFNIQFKLEDFNEAKKYIDQLLQLNSNNPEYNKKSTLLEKILQKYKAAKYTLDKIDIDWINNQSVKKKSKYIKWIKLDRPITVTIDGQTGEGNIIKPLEPIKEKMDEHETSGI